MNDRISSWVFLGLCSVALLPACGPSRSPGGTSSHDDDASAPTAPITLDDALASPIALGEIHIEDLTAPELVVGELDGELSALVQAQWYGVGRFAPTTKSDSGACRGHLEIGYVLMKNNQPTLVADRGEATVMVRAEVFCPKGGHVKAVGDQDVEAFKVVLEDSQPFGGEGQGPGPAVLRQTLRSVLERSAQATYGQVVMRSASDAMILEALSRSKHTGILSEAAGEAGERKLLAAVDDLTRLTGHQEELVSVRAGAALGLLKDPRSEVIHALAAMTRGPSLERHLVAVNALGDIGGDDAIRYLDSIALGHPDETIRAIARDILRGLRRPNHDDQDRDQGEDDEPLE